MSTKIENDIEAMAYAFAKRYSQLENAAEIFKKAFASKGKRKGFLKAKCPPSDSLEAAVWQACQSNVNPYKVSISWQMFADDEQRKVFDDCNRFIEVLATIADIRSLDYDRTVLSNLGAW